MSSSPSEPVENGRGKNKKKWSVEEDNALMEALVDLAKDGTHKADNGFKPGYLLVLENALARKLPGCNIKGDPHIKSRMKIFKRDFNIVHEMITGPNVSGFGWDDSKKCVTAEKEVWKTYLAAHKEATPFVHRPFPMYDDLLLVFGKDRATGKDAQAPGDMLEDVVLEKENNTNMDEMLEEDELEENTPSPLGAQRANGSQSEGSSAQKKQRKSTNQVSNELGSSIVEAAELLKSSINDLSQTLGGNVIEMRNRINEELSKLTGITMTERHRALKVIGTDPEITAIFFTIPDYEKEAFVM